jgi:type IV pilus assembly protein PilX
MNPQASRRQHGFSLIVSLILLVLITLVALGSMRTVSMQTRMSATTHDRNLAFQAAETALREAEAAVIAAGTTAFPSSGCTGLFCATPDAAAVPRWSDAAFTNWTAATTAVSEHASTPEAYIEYIGRGPTSPGCASFKPTPVNCFAEHYRVTTRSAADDRANVMLQSEVVSP